MVFSTMKPMQSSQKAVSTKPSKPGKKASRLVAPKKAPKTKAAKGPSTVKGRKITSTKKGNTIKRTGAPLAKKTPKGVLKAK